MTDTVWISATEQAKMIRRALREAYSSMKFSVRQGHGGGSVRVEWIDGPTAAQVDAIVQRFAGGGFDSSQDLAYRVRATVDGRPAQFAASHIFTTRMLSREFVAARLPRLAARYGVPVDAVTIRGSDGHSHWLDMPNPRAYPSVSWDDLRRMDRDLERISLAAPLTSPTAARVGA